MKLNVKEFKDVLKKATLNYSIDSVMVNVTKNTVESKMVSNARDAIVVLSLPNNVLQEMKESEYSLTFSEPNINLKPYIELIEDEIVPVKITDKKMVINKQANVHFHDPSIISTFNRSEPQEGTTYFVEMNMDEDFVEKFKKIKKIGNRFGKVYFSVKDKTLYIETTDKTNAFSNGVTFSILEDVNSEDLDLCFNYKNMVNLMTVINSHYSDFAIKLAYMEDFDLGMLFAHNSNGENYYLMSSQE